MYTLFQVGALADPTDSGKRAENGASSGNSALERKRPRNPSTTREAIVSAVSANASCTTSLRSPKMPVSGERSPEYSTKEVPKRASLPQKAIAGATIRLSALATSGTPVCTAHAEPRPESRRLPMTSSWKAIPPKPVISSEISCTGHTDGPVRPALDAAAVSYRELFWRKCDASIFSSCNTFACSPSNTP